MVFQYSCIPFEMFALCCADFERPRVASLIFVLVSSLSSRYCLFLVFIIIGFTINMGKNRKIVKDSKKLIEPRQR